MDDIKYPRVNLASRGSKILRLLRKNLPGNQDPSHPRGLLLRKNPIDKNLKRKQPWEKEYNDGNSIQNGHEDSPKPTKVARKCLFPQSPNVNSNEYTSSVKTSSFTTPKKHRKPLKEINFSPATKSDIPVLFSQDKSKKTNVETSPSLETQRNVPNNSSISKDIPLRPHLSVNRTSGSTDTEENLSSSIITESPNLNIDNCSSPLQNSSFTRQTEYYKPLKDVNFLTITKNDLFVSKHSSNTTYFGTSPSIESLRNVPNNSSITMVIPVSPHLNFYTSPGSTDTEENLTISSSTLPDSPNLNINSYLSPVQNYSFTRQTKYPKPIKGVNGSPITTNKLPVFSLHNSNKTLVETSPSIETVRNMPNNSSITMNIPVSPHLSVNSLCDSENTEENLSNCSMMEKFITESPIFNVDLSTNKYNSSNHSKFTLKNLNNKTLSSNVPEKLTVNQEKILFNDSSETIHLEKNEIKKRKWDRKNFCVYCEKLITNFSKHMTNIHSNEESVMKYCAILDSDLKIRKQRRQAIFDELRKQGNFLYNQKVLQESITLPTQAMLLPVKRCSSVTNDQITSHIHCKVCLGLFSRKTFYRHASQCGKENKDDEDILPVRNSFIKEKGLELNLCSDQANEILREKIFPLLRKDQKGIAAVTDPLIVSVASDFLSNHTSNKDKYNVTNKMRDAGGLLLKMKEKDPTILTFNDCFDVQQIDNIILCVQEMSQCDLSTGTVGVVGMPARLSWVINESCSKIIDNIITSQSFTDNYKDSLKRKIMDFQCVIRRRWKYVISTMRKKQGREMQ